MIEVVSEQQGHSVVSVDLPATGELLVGLVHEGFQRWHTHSGSEFSAGVGFGYLFGNDAVEDVAFAAIDVEGGMGVAGVGDILGAAFDKPGG